VGTTELVSKSSDGVHGNGHSYNKEITPDGRYLVFASDATNLVPNDTNAKTDIFVHDRATGTTERVSVASDGTQADDWSYAASISADGRYVAFQSYANNLVAGEQTYFSQVYVHDRINGITERVSVATDGTLGNASSSSVSINADGRYVAFTSSANNLVPGDTNGYYADIFVHDRLNGVTERISVASDGSEANHRSGLPAISADGQTVAFISDASNLVPGDTNNVLDIFVHTRTSGVTERVSVGSDSTQANGWSGGPSISSNGQFVTFTSGASNLVNGDTNNFNDVFIHDRSTATTERVSVQTGGGQLNDDSYSGSVSADGRYVAFLSYANSLDTGTVDWWYSDIFVHDRVTDTTELISLSSDGVQANDDSNAPTISDDGRFVAFDSYAAELVPDDNGLYRNDVFVRDRNPQ
jgi:Tol biopolymer transport system component